MNSTSPTIPSKKSPKRKINKISPSPFRGVLSLSAAATNTMLMMIPTAISEDDHDNTSTNHHKNKHSNLNPPNPENNEEKNSSNPSKTDKIDSSSPTTTMPLMPPSASARSKPITTFRSRKNPTNRLLRHSKRKRHRLGSSSKHHNANALNLLEEQPPPPFLRCCRDRTLVRSTLSCMNLVAKMLFWSSALASVAAVVWYSYELKNNGTDPHLIAWFSAGAFVLLGFPISMYGVVMHLANYNQPNVQCYIVRILWMVPIYSIESWLCLRYFQYAIYIETLRDCYESYVLYCFLQFLIQVMGGEEALILMLKDKSPTRGVHMWGLQWCVKPWLMGQPIRKTYEPFGEQTSTTKRATFKRVHWTSPFFVKCKFGVLQYVLLKFICSIVVMILELLGIYKEGDFTYKGGYLYICILTNVSQCWALYCLIFFYYATKNELSPIRPVGKFLSVKALVFFTWWQSVCISMLYQMDFIPHYISGAATPFSASTSNPMDDSLADYPLSQQDALMLDEFGGSILTIPPKHTEWSAEDVAKGLQDYLICFEMLVAAIVHIFVFPHTEYDPQAVQARASALNQTPHKDWNKRLGRKWKEWDNKSGYSGTTTGSSELELLVLADEHNSNNFLSVTHRSDSHEEDDLRIHPMDLMTDGGEERKPLLLEPVESVGEYSDNDDDEDGYNEDDEVDYEDIDLDDIERATAAAAVAQKLNPKKKQGFVSALLDSTIPQDLRDNTVGIIKGDYVVEKKTLLHHAATSDSYDLFSRFPKRKSETAADTTPTKEKS